MSILIKNGRVIDPLNKLDKITSVFIENGYITHLGESSTKTPTQIIDAQNKWVLPGLVDLCCRPHMRHPQGTTLVEEARAAVKRGVTSLCIPPDSNPILDTTATILRITQLQDQRLPHLYPIGALTTSLNGKSLADLTALKEAGCVAFTNAQHTIENNRILKHCMDYAASFDLLLIIQPQDPSLKKGLAHLGAYSSILGLPGVPETAETLAIAQHLLLIEESGVRAHFTCLSSKRAVQQIYEAKQQGLRVSADTAMHSLHLTDKDIGLFNPHCHLIPPLRDDLSRTALLKGIKENTIDAICSDHRPLDMDAKLAPFGDSTPGMSTIDTFLSLGLQLTQNSLSIIELIAALTYKPAAILNLPAGSLRVGAKADICIVDPHKEWVVDDKTLFSKGKNSAFKQWKLSGSVTHTLVNGLLVYENSCEDY